MEHEHIAEQVFHVTHMQDFARSKERLLGPAQYHPRGEERPIVAEVVDDVRGGADAFIVGSDVQLNGELSLSAKAAAEIVSETSVEARSAGLGALGNGDSTAVGILLSSNVVLGGANAQLLSSILPVTAAATDVTVTAHHDATISSVTRNAVTTGEMAMGMTFAFNAVGWAAQDFLTNTLDAILAAPLAAELLYGNEIGTGAKAQIFNTPVFATGKVAAQASTDGI